MLNIKALFTEILKWINRDTSPKVLWSGGSYMLAAQTANLSETVQNQHHGIVLIWSGTQCEAQLQTEEASSPPFLFVISE